MNQHKGILEQLRETDYLAGALPFEIRVKDGNWEQYLPDFDKQKLDSLETDACVPFSAVQSVETQVNFLLAQGAIPQAYLDQLKQLNFVDASGKFHFHASERYIAKLDGTNENGTPMVAPPDAMRKFGLIPFSDWTFTEGMTWDDFYSSIPANLILRGKQFLNFFDIQYEWIKNGGPGTPVALMQTHLQQAPLCIGAPVCEPWDQVSVPTCSSLEAAHSTLVYNVDTITHFFDHYVPFKKVFALDYNIPFILKIVVTVKPLPLPSVPTNVAPTQQNVTLLQKILSLYQQLATLINKGRNPSGTTMFSNSHRFWNWFFVSSEDPTQVSATARGAVSLLVPLLAFAIKGPDFSNLPNDVYTGVMDFFAVVSAALTLAGFVRKLWNTYVPNNSQQ
jgi:hypothetical protein